MTPVGGGYVSASVSRLALVISDFVWTAPRDLLPQTFVIARREENLGKQIIVKLWSNSLAESCSKGKFKNESSTVQTSKFPPARFER